MHLSAHCNRVPVIDGHMASVSVALKNKATPDEMIDAWESYTSEAQRLKLPTAPLQPLLYHRKENHPQPKLHRHLADGMVISVGRLRACPLFDWKFTLLSHNIIRGAAGCALLNAELLVKKGYLT